MCLFKYIPFYFGDGWRRGGKKSNATDGETGVIFRWFLFLVCVQVSIEPTENDNFHLVDNILTSTPCRGGSEKLMVCLYAFNFYLSLFVCDVMR